LGTKISKEQQEYAGQEKWQEMLGRNTESANPETRLRHIEHYCLLLDVFLGEHMNLPHKYCIAKCDLQQEGTQFTCFTGTKVQTLTQFCRPPPLGVAVLEPRQGLLCERTL